MAMLERLVEAGIAIVATAYRRRDCRERRYIVLSGCLQVSLQCIVRTSFPFLSDCRRCLIRPQVILLSKSFFVEDTIREHTHAVVDSFHKSVPMANGDLYVLSVDDFLGRQYLLASFHGDTDGLATMPVFAAVHELAVSMPDHRLVFGLDANTYEVGLPGQLKMSQFASDFVSKGYSSCWGDTPDPGSHTTFNARTFLQAPSIVCIHGVHATLEGMGVDVHMRVRMSMPVLVSVRFR